MPYRYLPLLLLALLLPGGCASYRTPAPGVPLAELTVTGSAQSERRPAAAFPARIALARVQAADYAATNPSCQGSGRYCVVTVRNIESERDIQRLRTLPQVAALEGLPLAQLPQTLNAVDDLRPVAAALAADLLLLYTLDTRFTVDGAEYGPLAELKPGYLPNRQARVNAKTTAVLVDARTGYVYGRVEANSWTDQNAAVWVTRAAIEDERRMTERASFELFVGKFGTFWQDVVATYARH
ncbi:MAG: hypothetical protein R3F42_12500 [Pseudomonadota bacterium]